MSLAIEAWPTFAEQPVPASPGVTAVWRLEVHKLIRQLRVRVVTALCLLVPFAVLIAVEVQDTLPSDTLFGQWLHQSGAALPMVIVAGAGQWVFPLLASLVAGDIFSAEDHFGTWKTVLTRSCTRGHIFVGKALAVVVFALAELLLLAGASVAAAAVLGARPVVGLSGQLVPQGRAMQLVVETWATQVPPLLGFAALAVFLSVASRSSPVGIGGPLVLGLAMTLTSLVNLPTAVSQALLSTPFGAWHGLWTQPSFYGPLREGLVTCGVWFALCAGGAWMLFRRRGFGAW